MATTLISRAMRGCFCFVVLFCVAAMPSASRAAAPKGGNTRILSEKMTYDSVKNQVVFEGKVHVTRPDMEIWSETLTLVLDDSGKKTPASSGSGSALGVEGGGKVERIIAEKNVRIKQGNKTATSGEATYFINAGKIVMKYNPVLVDGDNRIKGRVIEYYTETGRSKVIGDVDVQFSTEDSKGPSLSGLSTSSEKPATPAPSDAKAAQ